DLQLAAVGFQEAGIAEELNSIDEESLAADVGVDDAAAVVLQQRQLLDQPIAGDVVAVVDQRLGAENPGDGAPHQPQLAVPAQRQRVAGSNIDLERAVNLDAVRSVG